MSEKFKGKNVPDLIATSNTDKALMEIMCEEMSLCDSDCDNCLFDDLELFTEWRKKCQ